MGVTRAVRDEGGSRYLASRLRDGWPQRASRTIRPAPEPPPNTKRPGGGHPVRVVGGLGRFNETVCELYRREVFPPDVVLCFNCFVAGNTSVSEIGPKPMAYPLKYLNFRRRGARRHSP